MTRQNIQAKSRRIASQAISILVVVSILLSAVPAPAAANSPTYNLQCTQQFSTSQSMGDTTVHNGSVYISDGADEQIHRYNPDTCSITWTNNLNVNIYGALTANDNGVYVTSTNDDVRMYNLSNGNFESSVSYTGVSGGPRDLDSEGSKVTAQMGGSGDPIVTVSTSTNSVSKDSSFTPTTASGLSVQEGPDAIAQGDNADIYFAGQRTANGHDDDLWNVQKDGTKNGAFAEPTAANFIDDIDVRDLSSSEEYILGYDNGNVTMGRFSTSSPAIWNTTTAGGDIDVVTHAPAVDVIVAGDATGSAYFLNPDNGGNNYKTITFTDTSEIQGVGAHNGYVSILQADGSMRVYETTVNQVTSIDLEIDDKTLVPTQTTNYDVNATLQDGTYTDKSSSSTVTSDDTTTVSVDTANTELDYQSDGTTTIRANYTNASGTTVWSNKSVEADTPQLTISVDKNPIGYTRSGNYTVTKSSFGTTDNISSSASVTSDNTSVITVTLSSESYTAKSVTDTANLTASTTVSGQTYSDDVEISVQEPTAITWQNWDFLNGGERMILIGSDWTFLYIFGSAISSSLVAFTLRSPKIGVISFSGLTILGWPLGFIPNYVALTVIIFLIFMAFVFNFTTGGDVGLGE